MKQVHYTVGEAREIYEWNERAYGDPREHAECVELGSAVALAWKVTTQGLRMPVDMGEHTREQWARALWRARQYVRAS